MSKELPPILVSMGGIPYNKAHIDAAVARAEAAESTLQPAVQGEG